MEILPDDVWYQILKTGTETDRLDHKDLCSLSITCRYFHKLAQDSSMWAILLDRDFHPSHEAPSKALYREGFELGFNRKDRSLCGMFEDGKLTRRPLYEQPLHSEPQPNYHDDLLHLQDRIDYLTIDNGKDAIGHSSTNRSTHVPYVKGKFFKRRSKKPRPKVKPNSYQ